MDGNAKLSGGEESCAGWELQINGAYSQGGVKKRESDGGHFAKRLTYGLIRLSELGDRASKRWRKMRK